MIAFSSFIRNPPNTAYDGEDADEKILYIIRRSQITNLPWIFTSAVLMMTPFFMDPFLRTFIYNDKPVVGWGFITGATLFWYLFTFGYTFQNFLNWYFNVLVITTKKIIDMDFHGITYKNISEATLTNVEDVTSNVSGPFHMIFNFGDLYIQTAGEKPEFEFRYMDDPSKIRDILADLVASIKHRHGNN